MDSATISFGQMLYRSKLSPEQILHEVSQLTTPKKWIRNPFADFSSPFEGTVTTDGFELLYLTRIRTDRTVPRVKVLITMDDVGKTLVLIRLKKTLGAQLWNLMLVSFSAYLGLLTVTEHKHFFLVFAILIAGLRWFRYLPDQFHSRQILNLLKQRLELTLLDTLPAA
jgi:hypothetical protein